jgi:drug/metabolite transporter (DMT)-like permease
MESTSATSAPPVSRPVPRDFALLWLGVISASFSAILIRYADGAEPLAISFWRCAGGALVLLPFARSGLGTLQPRAWRMPVVAGAFLAVHFATWITSLELTTVASSVLLVSTTPIFATLGAWLLLSEPVRARGWGGVLLAFSGTALVAGGDLSGSSLDGNLLALIGGATAGGYVLAGRRARQAVGILEYAVIAYAVAGVALLVACAAGGVELWGYDAGTWWAIVGILVGPQLLGHTIINFVLKDIDVTTVSVSIMAEPVIATVLAFLLFDEVPPALLYPGGAAILAGIYLTSTARRQVPEPAPT